MKVSKKMTNYKVIRSKQLSKDYESRYIIIDAKTLNILDDANGYGYKSKENAYKAWKYKTRSFEDQNERNKKYEAVIKWIDKNKKIIDELDNMAFYALKDGDDLTTKDIEEVIGKHEEFTTKQFIYVYHNYNKVKRNLKKKRK